MKLGKRKKCCVVIYQFCFIWHRSIVVFHMHTEPGRLGFISWILSLDPDQRWLELMHVVGWGLAWARHSLPAHLESQNEMQQYSCAHTSLCCNIYCRYVVAFFNMCIYSLYRITCFVFYMGVLKEENVVYALILLYTANFRNWILVLQFRFQQEGLVYATACL